MAVKPNTLTDDEDDIEEEGAPATGKAKPEDGDGKAAAAESDDGEELVVIEEADEEAGDKRLDVGAQAGETEEQKRERRRDEKRQRRERQRQARAQGEARMAEQERKIEELTELLGSVTQHLTSRERGELQQRLLQAKQTAKEAAELIAKAGSAGDGASLAQAMQIRDDAVFEARQLEQAISVADKRRPTERPPQGTPKLAPAVLKHAKTFQDEHDWYSPQGGDTDSRVVLALDSAVAGDGFDPASEEYWEELNDRVREYLPHRFANGGNAGQRTGAKGPQLGGKRSSAPSNGKRTVFVSRERKEAMQEAGLWDDPKVRARVLKRYADHDAQHSATRNG